MSKQTNWIDPKIEKSIDSLLDKMTIEEKVGQITQLGPSIIGGFDWGKFFENPDPELLKNVKRDFHEDWVEQGLVGSYLGIEGAEEINRLQKIAVEKTRLGIPLIFGLDVIHGYRTIFPIPLAEACSWEPDLAERTAAIAAAEAAAAGLHWTFAPMVDIARDPRWGRIAEGAGEDPCLGSAFAAARVKGFQGEGRPGLDKVAACAKHFVAYGAALAGRDYHMVDMSDQTMQDVYLPPFQAAADAGAMTFMSSFNDLNGVPATGNRFVLTELLRGQMGFNGFVVSDSNSIGELIPHRYATDRADAGLKAITAGVDMDMVTESYRWEVPQMVADGRLSIDVVNEAVRRVLRVKFLLGFFDNPYRGSSQQEAQICLSARHRSVAYESAVKSMVLLKNEGDLLPLDQGLSIALIGPLADNAADMLGSWSFTGSPTAVINIRQGMQARFKNITYAKCCDILTASSQDLAEAVRVAKRSDVIVAVVGESAAMSGEAASRQTLGLPGQQEELLKVLKQTGKPLVVLLSNGRPLALPWVSENADAILETWQLGVEAGNAIADVLAGVAAPSGKLAATFPYSTGQLPIYYSVPATGRPASDFKFTSKYIDGPNEPIYPFGFGLTYTTFEYSDLKVSCDGNSVMASAIVTNTGKRLGEEIVQFYTADLVASRVRPVKELKAFRKVSIAPAASVVVEFKIPVTSLGFHDSEMKYVVERGAFKAWIGGCSDSGLEGGFVL